MEDNAVTSLKISLKQTGPQRSQSNEKPYPKSEKMLKRAYSAQIRVKPIRSEVLTSKPSSSTSLNIYASISEESEYINLFTESDYANGEEDSIPATDRCPTLPPRQLMHYYSTVQDDEDIDSPLDGDDSDQPFCCLSLNDPNVSVDELPLIKQLENIISEIHRKFNDVRNELKKREDQLINVVEEAKKKYYRNVYKYRSRVTKISDRINKLGSLNYICENSIQKMTELNNIRNNCIRTGVEENFMSFHMPRLTINQVGGFGELREEVIPQYNKMYATNRQYRGKAGKNINEIDYPMGVAVDQETNNVYVVDQGVPKVCVVNPDGKVQVFGKTNTSLIQPHGICVKNGKVYVTDNNRENNTGEVLVYNTKGRLLGKCSREGELKEALGISVDSNENIYVCDGTSNSIQVFDSKFNCKEEFIMPENTQPLDICVNDTHLFILAEEANDKWCLLIYDKSGQYVGDILDENIQAEFGNVQFFTMDVCGNFIIADQTTHCLRVLSKFGDHITNIVENDKIGLFMPNGVEINKDNKIVTSWVHGNTALRMF